MYKINIYGCAMFKKLVCQWVKSILSSQLAGNFCLVCLDRCVSTVDLPSLLYQKSASLSGVVLIPTTCLNLQLYMCVNSRCQCIYASLRLLPNNFPNLSFCIQCTFIFHPIDRIFPIVAECEPVNRIICCGCLSFNVFLMSAG